MADRIVLIGFLVILALSALTTTLAAFSALTLGVITAVFVAQVVALAVMVVAACVGYLRQ